MTRLPPTVQRHRLPCSSVGLSGGSWRIVVSLCHLFRGVRHARAPMVRWLFLLGYLGCRVGYPPRDFSFHRAKPFGSRCPCLWQMGQHASLSAAVLSATNKRTSSMTVAGRVAYGSCQGTSTTRSLVLGTAVTTDRATPAHGRSRCDTT